MRIDYHDSGAVAKVIITSTVFEYRKHNRVVDAALFLTPGTIAKRSGLFVLKSIISGKSRDVLRAYRVVVREVVR
ncbi:hypothetical protein GJV07_16350 [Enterobacteriaceae bacterium RIT711]|nr:hypothetical protein [Enterobacteriaceae bacterium RIT711]